MCISLIFFPFPLAVETLVNAGSFQVALDAPAVVALTIDPLSIFTSKIKELHKRRTSANSTLIDYMRLFVSKIENDKLKKNIT